MLPAIAARRSIFPQFFTEQPVSEAVIGELLAAANCAPSHRKTEPWRFRVYRDNGKERLKRELLVQYGIQRPDAGADDVEKIARKFGEKIDRAAAVLVVLLHRDPQERVPEWEEIAAVGAAVENLWLSLDRYDLGGYWSSPGFLCTGYGDWPGTASNERCLGLFYLGHYDAPDLPRPRGDWREKVVWL